MRHLLAISILCALATPAVAATSLEMANGYGWAGAVRDIDPQGLGRLFCDARRSGDMAPLGKFYAPKLAKLLAEADATGAQVPWQSRPDHPDSCTVAILNGFDDTVGVLVEIAYRTDGIAWTDTLNLERTPDSWLLNNVFYEGGGNLRFRLAQTLP